MKKFIESAQPREQRPSAPIAMKPSSNCLPDPTEGGTKGGEIVAAGTPHEIACAPRSYTGEFLKKLGL